VSPLYEILTTVRVYAETPSDAYSYVRHALEHAKKAEIEHVDSEIVETFPEEGAIGASTAL